MVTFTLLNQRGQEFNLRETIERYITDTNKAKSGYIAGKFVNNDIVDCMDRVARLLGEEGGAKAIHFELSFGPEELFRWISLYRHHGRKSASCGLCCKRFVLLC